MVLPFSKLDGNQLGNFALVHIFAVGQTVEPVLGARWVGNAEGIPQERPLSQPRLPGTQCA